MSGQPQVIVRREGTVGRVLFSNPARRNAMTMDMWLAVPAALQELDADPAIRVIVLEGAGDVAFVSGADISQFEGQRSTPEAVQRYEEIGDTAQSRLQSFDKPTIAMIRGYCIGGGLGIAAACDLRIAAEDARFSIPAAKLGLGYRAASMKKLVDIVGAAYAKEIMLTARQFSAAEAKEMGLVHRVVPVPQLEALTREYCEAIAANAPLTMRAAKRIIREVVKSEHDAALCERLVKECFDSADYKEGRRAFMEKRKPVFTGR
jgi:enoyl-CoA hydratase/carnithine racemase